VVAVGSPNVSRMLWQGQVLYGTQLGFIDAFPDGVRTWLVAASEDLSVLESGVVRSIGAKVGVAGPCR
jgi:hypothetical protein